MSSAVVRPEVVDAQRRGIAAAHARKLGVVLPTFSQLADASSMSSGVSASLAGVGPDQHNIQGIGDKHIPFIHNVMNTDVVIGVSDRVSDSLNVLFGTDVGRKYLQNRRKLDASLIAAFDDVGISGFANIVASIKLAKHFDYGPNDVIVTIATDNAALYDSERDIYLAKRYSGKFDEVNAGEVFGADLESIADDHVMDLTHATRRRIFNLGYYIWVEQQDTSAEDFEVRKDQSFWEGLIADIPAWDRLIEQFNEKAGVAA
jgi:cysteine synthase A